MKIIKRKIITDTFVVMLLTYGVSLFIIDNLSNFLSLDPQDIGAGELTDFYNKVTARQYVNKLNQDICIIATDNCSRNQLPMLIDAVAYCNPRVIGIDIMFEHPADNDEELVVAINDCRNVVMPVRLIEEAFPEGNKHINAGDNLEVRGSCFDFLLNDASFGAVNFPVSESGIIRNFNPVFIIRGDTVLSFTSAITKIVEPDKFSLLVGRENSIEDIPYRNTSFLTLDAFELINQYGSLLPESEELLKDKIVLLSDVNSPFDFHKTPSGAVIPGIEIHARILDTVLSGDYLHHVSPFVENIITLLCCLLFSFLVVLQKNSVTLNNVWALILRLFQILIIYILMVVGCSLYIYTNTYYEFSTLLIIMADTMLIADIWFGLKEAWTLMIEKFKIKKLNRENEIHNFNNNHID